MAEKSVLAFCVVDTASGKHLSLGFNTVSSHLEAHRFERAGPAATFGRLWKQVARVEKGAAGGFYLKHAKTGKYMKITHRLVDSPRDFSVFKDEEFAGRLCKCFPPGSMKVQPARVVPLSATPDAKKADAPALSAKGPKRGRSVSGSPPPTPTSPVREPREPDLQKVRRRLFDSPRQESRSVTKRM
jgi:hypothetical protein